MEKMDTVQSQREHELKRQPPHSYFVHMHWESQTKKKHISRLQMLAGFEKMEAESKEEAPLKTLLPLKIQLKDTGDTCVAELGAEPRSS